MDHTTNETDKANYEKTMNDLQKTRDESIQQAMDSYKSDLETFYESNGEYEGRINEKTGEIFSKPELKSQGVMQKQEDTHSGLSDITESGVYALKNNVTGNLDELYVSVDENSNEIMGIYNATLNATGSYSDAEKETLNSVKDSFSGVGQEIDYLIQSHARLNTETGNMVTAGGSVIQALTDITTASDGVITGIMEINNTPYQITCDASGAIQNIQAVTEAAESVPTDTTANVDTNAADASQQLDGVTESANAIPPDTPANVSTNAGEQKGVVDSLLSSLREIGGHVWSGIVNITKNVAEKFSSSDDSGSVAENASGTDYATSGLSTVNERGWELSDRTVPIIGGYNNNPLVNLQSGTKIRSHMDSMNDMRTAVKEEVSKQVPHGTYQVAQPQVQIAGGGNIDMGGININVDGNQNVEAMINQAMLQFGNTLRQAFSNIKK
ncbi:MAG: phage tail tape measure protein, partial [Lachnospiraceae bacterium]|nr:phage tail tape measure protein [Lachnospiraceae bacterium]